MVRQTEYGKWGVWQTISYHEYGEPMASRKPPNICADQEKIQAFKQKLGFSKNYIRTRTLTAFSIFKELSHRITGDFNKCDFFQVVS